MALRGMIFHTGSDTRPYREAEAKDCTAWEQARRKQQFGPFTATDRAVTEAYHASVVLAMPGTTAVSCDRRTRGKHTTPAVPCASRARGKHTIRQLHLARRARGKLTVFCAHCARGKYITLAVPHACRTRGKHTATAVPCARCVKGRNTMPAVPCARRTLCQ